MRAREAPACAPEAIGLDGLRFRYRGASQEALRGVALSLKAGQLLAVIGASGAGKSTLALALAGLIPSFYRGHLSGTIRLAGRTVDPNQQTVAERAGTVGIVFQDFEAQLFTTETTLEVAFGAESLGLPRLEIERRVARALGQVGLAGFEGRSPISLSGGEKQRLAIAATLALEPPILVLDEPTTDLDPEGKRTVLEVLHALRDEGRTVVVVEHELEELGTADRALLLSSGQAVKEGPFREVSRDASNLSLNGVRPPEIPSVYRLAGLPVEEAPIDDDAAAASRLTAHGAFLDPEAVRAIAASDPEPPTAAPLLEACGLRYRYEGRTLPALDGVDLAVCPGEMVAILGANGSGKSTLARHLNGLLRPQEGAIRLRGQEARGLPRSSLAREVGFVFQNPDHQIFCATVEEEVAFGPRNFGLHEAEVERRVAAALETVGLAGARGRDPFALPKGDRQRLAVASVLALDTPLILMDEPTTGLDYRDQRRMMELLARLNAEGRTVIFITHHIWIAVEYAHRIVLMAAGRIIKDAPTRQAIADGEGLAAAHIRLPPLVRLAKRLGAPLRSLAEVQRCLRMGAVPLEGPRR